MLTAWPRRATRDRPGRPAAAPPPAGGRPGLGGGPFGPGSQVVSVRPLASAWLANHAVDVADAAGRVHGVVLRRWARPGWDEDDPDFTAAREAAILDLLDPTPVPAPALVAADPDAAACDVPALLLALLPGGPPDLAADLDRLVEDLAAALPAIHAVAVPGRSRRRPRVTGPAPVPAYHRFYEPEQLAPPAWSARPELWARAFEVASGPPPHRPCFIHRDYHPGNTLWDGPADRGGRLDRRVVGAAVGRPRPHAAEPGLGPGPGAADRFLAAHHALTGFDHDPVWDVVRGRLHPRAGLPRPPRSRGCGAWRTWSRPPWPPWVAERPPPGVSGASALGPAEAA